MSYQPNIPTGLLDLSVDYLNIKNNFTALNNVFGVDHTTFDNATSNKGYHTVIHAISQSGDPTQISGTGELYVKTVNSGGANDTALFFRTGTNGFVSQITSNLVPVVPAANVTNGYTYLPGGLVLQWGTVAPNSNTTTTVTFSSSGGIAFPNYIYNVQVTRQRPTSDPGSSYEFYIDNSTISKTQFQIINRDGHSYGYYWIAIGN